MRLRIKKKKNRDKVSTLETQWGRQRKPSVQSWLVGLREWGLKWLERRLAKRGITDCRSWIWRAAFGLSKRWALHNPIFLPKHRDTVTGEAEMKALCACVCACAWVCVFPLCRCWSLALVRPLGKFRNYCGWTMYKVECVWETKTGRDTMCISLNQHWTFGDAGSSPQLPYNPPTGICTWKHPHTYAHICISLPLCKGIKETFKERQRLARGLQGPSPCHWRTRAD